MIVDLLASFNAGELDPRMDARTGLEKYQAGCRTLKNFIPVPFGGASKRPGTVFLAECPADKKARVEAFRFSTTTQFVMEFSHQKIRFYKNKALVLDPLFAIYSVATPYAEADLFDLQIKQINDVVFVVHPNYEPRRLVRYADNNWQLEQIPWEWPPLRDENVDGAHTIDPSGTAGAITLTSSVPLFDPGMVGGYFALAWADVGRQVNVQVSSTSDTTTDSAWLYVVGTWNAYSFNYAKGTYEIHRSFDNGVSFEVIRSYKIVQGDRNFTTSGQESKACWLRVRLIGSRFDYGGSGNYDVHATIEALDQRLWGLVKITGVGSSGSLVANATVVETLPKDTATWIWAEGAFSTYRGFPRTVQLHEGRVWYGGNAAEPMRLWASVTDDFYNFRRTSLADGSVAATIDSPQAHQIQWLTSGSDALLVGTRGMEYAVSGGGNDAPIGPGNITARVQSSYGSAYLPAILVNYVTLFVQRSRLRVREFVFSLQVNGFVAADMTRLANHITQPGIVQWGFQQSYDAIVWAITSDGTLIGLTYEREDNVVGWHRHETDGTFESVTVLYGAEGQADEVYLVSKRVINGVTKRYVEILNGASQEAQQQERGEDCVFLDSAKIFAGVNLTALAGLGHLEGKSVGILADGAKRANLTVVAGAITLPEPADKIVVGLPYEALLKPMKIEVPMRDGTAQSRKWKLHGLAIRVWKSVGGDARSNDGETWEAIHWRDTSDPLGVAIPLFTGEKFLRLDSESEQSLEFAVRSNDPHPFTIIALMPRFDVRQN